MSCLALDNVFFGRQEENTKIQELVEENEVKKLSFEMTFAKFMTHALKLCKQF